MAMTSRLKGVRTRYINTLKRASATGKELLDADLSDVDLQQHIHDVIKCKDTIVMYNEKLNDQSEKLSEAYGDSEPELMSSIEDEDAKVIDEATDVYLDLKQLQDKINEQEKEIKCKKIESESETKSQYIQNELRSMYEQQLKFQEQFYEKQMHKPNDKPTTVKLPTLEISPFNGDKLKWMSFWDSFESAVHNNTKISEIDKFNYLRSKLVGEAKHSIDGLPLSKENYETAIHILKTRFGKRQEVIDLHYNALLDLPSAENNTISLRKLYDSLEMHLRSLSVMSKNIDQDVFVSMIRRKLPHEVLFQMEMRNSPYEWTVVSIREQLYHYIVARERSESVNTGTSSIRYNSENSNGARPKTNFTSNKPSYRSSINSNNRSTVNRSQANRCRYCDQQHWSDECRQYATIEERQKVLKGCCFKCLKDGHYSSDCKTSRSCVYCGQVSVHHRSLCPQKFQRRRIRESVHFAEVDDQGSDESKQDENMLLSSGETVLMQTAFTEIRNPCAKKGVKVRVIMDSGSQRSYITQKLAKELELKEEDEQEIRLVTFASENTKVIKTKSTSLEIQLGNGTFQSLSVNVVPHITGTIQRKPVVLSDQNYLTNLTKDLKLADTIPKERESGTIDILIGNDFYLDFIGTDRIEVQPGLYLLSSKFGWILTGRTPHQSDHCDKSEISMLILTYGNHISKSNVFTSIDSSLPRKPDIEDFWNIETIGIMKEDETNVNDEKAMQRFRNTLQKEGGRYQVTWPWKESVPNLPDNRNLAVGRLKSLTTKFHRQPTLLEKYDDIIQEQLEKGMIEKVEKTHVDGMKHYIPHHMVVKPLKTGVKLRLVYDASAKTRKENNSLNECLYRGPVLLQNLCGIIMRFRLHNIGIVADIEKAFLQVGLQKQDRDVTRFLWFKDINSPYVEEKHIQELRFCRVPFGIISSPFLLGATVESHLNTYDTDIAEKIKRDIYMDNVVTGTETVNQAKCLYNTSKQMFSEAMMNLREWKTSENEVNLDIPEKDLVKENDVNVLGHNWNIIRDSLSLNKIEILDDDEALTKRVILKQVSSVYDPLGLLSPVTLPGKCLIQNLWKKNQDWDDVVDQKDFEEWTVIKNELKATHSLEIPRCINLTKVQSETKYTLLCFCDASAKAYASTIYLHQESVNGSRSDLVFSKSRLAPVKEMSIPRLELLAVLIGVRSLKFVDNQLNLNLSQKVVMTDSQCVLQWITSTKTQQVFVQNRVKEIRSHSDLTFQYVNTKENPADVASRGCTLNQLRNNALWWHGPTWLATPIESWPQMCITEETKTRTGVTKLHEHECQQCDVSENQSQLEKETNLLTESSANDGMQNTCTNRKEREQMCSPPFNMDLNRYSSYSKLIRTTAWCSRFIRRLKGESFHNKSLTSDELDIAENKWVSYIQKNEYPDVIKTLTGKNQHNLVKQLGIFQDSIGLLRCKGRLEHADLCESARLPILLPNKSRLTQMVIENMHSQMLHSGTSQTLSRLRHKFWVPHGRSTVKTVLKSCLKCRRLEGGPFKMPLMAPLPHSRVSETVPFSHTGIDYMGPMYVKDNQDTKKVWICLFTCMVSRAIHLEMVQDMSTNTFLNGLRRFISTRGVPESILCDNAMHFKLGNDTVQLMWKDVVENDEVQSYCANKNIKWSFIVEMAPWMGGFYERLVGLVKRSLRKAIGRKILEADQLHTVIKEAEAVVNSRPLVYVEDDINSHITLTPSHFTCLNPKTGIPHLEYLTDTEYRPSDSSAQKLLEIWKKGQKLLDSFWQIWRSEYLLSLRERHQTRLKSKRIQSLSSPCIGDVVVIKDELPRGSWKLGKIINLKTSSDGQIRSADVKTPTGRIIGRPLSLLYPMEVTESSCVEKDPITATKIAECTSRPTRKAAMKAQQRIKDVIQNNA